MRFLVYSCAVARRVSLVVLGLVVVGALVLVALPGGREAVGDAVGWLRASGASGRAVAVGLVLVGIPLGIPTLWFAALIGYLYGAAGLAIALPAVVAGATLAFLVARFLLAEDVARLLARRRRFRAVAEGVGDGGARLVALLRLAGPHNLLNLVLAASPLTVGAFALGTAVGSVPSVALATLGGALAPDAAALWNARAALGSSWMAAAAVAAAGAIALAAAFYVTWRATQRALQRLEVEVEVEVEDSAP